jgi:hypothetical protein
MGAVVLSFQKAGVSSVCTHFSGSTMLLLFKRSCQQQCPAPAMLALPMLGSSLKTTLRVIDQ